MNDSDDDRLDRLNYYNGQRLEADDFRQEQQYHIYVRRALNRSLYSDGIAAGLEVTAKEGDLHKVVVSPGLALDQDGREIILLEDTEVQVMGTPSEVEGEVFGNYLCIAYEEEKTAELEDRCAMMVKGKKVTRTWGGPSRIRAGATLSIRPSWPTAAEKQVVLAQLELDKNCAIRDIHTYVRKYAVAAAKAAVHPFALEGEADIAEDLPKKIYFHIRGGKPDTLTLYLKGELFSPFYYTELGSHSHLIQVDTLKDGDHKHDVDLGSFTVGEDGSTHSHDLTADVQDGDKCFATETDPELLNENLNAHFNLKVSGGGHSHDLTGTSVEVLKTSSEHVHTIDDATLNTGASLDARASGDPLTYVTELQVLIDDVDYTSKILSQIGWSELGDGTDSHDFVKVGTGEVELTLLGVDLNEGQHIIELKVVSGGGRVRYNLYVE